ncbi:MAG: glycosyltransferase family 4 protein [Chitinispirillales bacterium]|jgi:glycosyltransferase involved in cell wall biosynthesis|nr:glycosyltransferase family 4 protein [Chitinispirillales bacterium]
MDKKIYLTNVYSSGIVNGGLATQARKTFEACRGLGLPVEIYNPWETINPQNIGAFHIFSTNYEMHSFSRTLYEKNIPQIVSSIFYTRHPAWKIAGIRAITKFISYFDSGTKSCFDYCSEIMKNAETILPNTNDELKQIRKLFKIPDEKITVVPNGVDKKFANANPQLFKKKYGDSDIILSVTMLGKERKNGLNLIKALGKIDNPSYIIGSFHTESDYGKLCKVELEKYPQVHYIGMFGHESEMLASAYASAKVFVLPSWLETPGIASMEAALAGAQIVTTPIGGTKDYFKDFGIYVNPYSIDSISTGIKTALSRSESEQRKLKEFIYNNFLWGNVAQKYKEIYEKYL